MKRTLSLSLSVMLMFALLVGCGGNGDKEPVTTDKPAESQNTDNAGNAEQPAQEGTALQDGLYYAEGEFAEDSGWKELVAIKVEGGKIVSANWNGLHKDGGLDKKTFSEKGFYGMKEKGGAQAEWHEQAAKMEEYLVAQQSVEGLALNDEGRTDAVSGVSIHVNGFTELAAKALAAGPVEAGPYKDGSYHAEADDFDAKSGWKETVDVTVINGKIAAVSWNGVHKDGGTDKVTRSKSGEYGMKNGGAQSEWHEQAYQAEQYLIEKQDPQAIVTGEDGKTDAISGVSIHVNGFVELAAKALEGAK
ncbi:FMN-binding protein [Paenibacillus sp. CR_12]|uniref:FMN-binding protein n=1 Tax=Paenibacillus sp. CR_12 TaxID=3055793 RepID=UPI0035C23629